MRRSCAVRSRSGGVSRIYLGQHMVRSFRYFVLCNTDCSILMRGNRSILLGEIAAKLAALGKSPAIWSATS